MSLLQTFTGAGVDGAITKTFRDNYTIWEKIRANFVTLNARLYEGTGSPEGVLTAVRPAMYLQTDGGAAGIIWVKTTTSGNTGWEAFLTLTSTGVLTGKTMSFREFWPAAVNDRDDLYAPGWHSTLADGPTPVVVSGANMLTAGLEFDDSATHAVHRDFHLPADWAGNIDLRLFWNTPATSGNVCWQIQTAFVADGATIDPAYNAAQKITDAAVGTTNRYNVATQTSIIVSGAAAGSRMSLKIFRDPADAADTLGDAARLLGAELTYRRTLTA